MGQLWSTPIQRYKGILEVAKRKGNKKEEAQAYLDLGEAYEENGEPAKAKRCFNNALKIAKDRKDMEQEKNAYNGLASASASSNEFQLAIEYLDKASKVELISYGNQNLSKLQDEVTIEKLSTSDANKRWSTVVGEPDNKKIQQTSDSAHSQTTQHNTSDSGERIDNDKEAIANEASLGGQKKRYNHFETVFDDPSKYRKAINVFKNERGKLTHLEEDNKIEIAAYHWLGCNFMLIGQHKESIDCYNELLKFACQIEDKKIEMNAYVGLGRAFSNMGDFESSEKYFLKALKMAKQHNDNGLLKETHIMLGNVYYTAGKFENALESYLNARNIMVDFDATNDDTSPYFLQAQKICAGHGKKKDEANICFMLGDTFQQLKHGEKAIESFQRAVYISKELKDKEMQKLAELRLRNSFALVVCCNDRDYKRALHVFGTKPCIDLGVTLLQLPRIEEVNQPIQAKKLAVKDIETPVSWKWKVRSIIHRQKFIDLREYAKTHPKEIKEVNGVCVCCSMEFLIGKGSDGTRVYVGLAKDGVEKAVKRLPRDACSSLAEQEKKILNELNAMRSKHVVNYWFLEEQSDKEYLFLILDLCEQTLENFVEYSSKEDLVKRAPDIIQQVLKGLVDLHRNPNPILHCDLKPSNILRNIEGNWLLADFGISRILTDNKTTHVTDSKGTEDWKAVESCSSEDKFAKVRYKKESDIQVAGMVAFYILTKSGHPFGEKRGRLDNLLDGKPVGLNSLKDEAAKDLIAWLLSHDPKDRPTAEEALKHPYLQPPKQQFEMLCKVGNQCEIKTGDVNSDVVRKLNSDPNDWRNEMEPDILKYLSTDCLSGRRYSYSKSWTNCLRLIRNVKEHWEDRPRPRAEIFYIVGNPQEFFLNLFPSLPAEVHRIIRSCDWKERDDLKEYFI